jgi:hypothetical protein
LVLVVLAVSLVQVLARTVQTVSLIQSHLLVVVVVRLTYQARLATQAVRAVVVQVSHHQVAQVVRPLL